MIGKKLAHYEIVEKLGQGGMGEVWTARDTTLDRDVAIKLLPDLLASDPERLARFEREAKLLASLNHPGIAAVYGLHEDNHVRFLAMELVPGEDLSRRLEQGPLSVEQTLFIGTQVAEALGAAHAQGVVHRDLKPANIMLTPDGKAKVLDFGLAKTAEGGDSSSVSSSPTVTTGGTAAGVVLGTAAYMSPEQARGRVVDRRTDVWSFGCVLFECLSGVALFKGETASDSLGAILHKEPDWSLLPAGTPPTVRLLLRRCLTKVRDKRLHDIADARIELEQAIEDPSGSSMGLADASIRAAEAAGARGRSGRWLTGAAAVLMLAAGLFVGWKLRGTPAEAPVRKLDLGVQIESGSEGVEAAISPDGAQIAFTHQGSLWVQALDALEPRALDGTEGAFAPFWSPEGDEIGYFAGGKLWRIPAVGGRGVAICDLGGEITGGRGASWAEDDRIIVSRGNTGLMAVPALGGTPVEIVPLTEGESDLHEPHVLPGDGGILFVAHPVGGPPNVLSAVHGGERRVLLDSGDQRLWSPAYDPSGHILVRRTGGDVTAGLWALPFSLDRLEVTGEPFLVVPDASGGTVSRDGTLAFVHHPPMAGRDHLVWVDRTGGAIEPIGDTRVGASSPSLSPDGRWMAFTMVDTEDRNFDLWVRDLERGTETRLTVDGSEEFQPLWRGSGQELLFSSFTPPGEGGPSVQAYVVPPDGSQSPRPLLENGVAADLTADGRSFVATRLAEGEPISTSSNTDIWLMSFEEDAEPRLLVGSPDRERGGMISPDGRWMAYQWERAGKSRLYLTRFPEATGRWQVSVGEAEDPKWDPRGDRLYFLEGSALMEVAVGLRSGSGADREPQLGRPTPLFDLPAPGADRGYTPSLDGERFVTTKAAVSEDDEARRSGIKLVQNWFAEFRR
jgi:Tol biopolymer transport system component